MLGALTVLLYTAVGAVVAALVTAVFLVGDRPSELDAARGGFLATIALGALFVAYRIVTRTARSMRRRAC